MNKLLIILLINVSIMFKFISAFGGKYNVSFDDLQKCNEYTAVTGYGYQTYFEIDDIKNTRQPDEILHIKLFILALKDAHILFTPTKSPNDKVPLYEIVIGGGGNTFSEIRRLRKSKPLKSVKRSGVLSAIDIVPVDIRITKAGNIALTIIGESTPLINITDPEPILNIKYLSFSSFGVTQGKFFYDCDVTNSDQLEEVIVELSPMERLRKDLLTDYDALTIPDQLSVIKMQFELIRTSFHTQKSFMTTRSVFNLNWTDPKLVWTPENYNDINDIQIVSSSELPLIWSPQITLINGKHSFVNKFNLEYLIQIQSNGLIKARSKEVVFETWCSDNLLANNWPYDELNCDITFGTHYPDVFLNPDVGYTFAKMESIQNDQSEWFPIGIQIVNEFSIKSAEFDNIDDINNGGGSDGDGVGDGYGDGGGNRQDTEELKIKKIAYRIGLKRNDVFYTSAFCSPLYASLTFILLSFWTTGYLRVALNLLGFIITIMVFIAMTNFTPVSYVPRLVRYYEFTLVMSWIIFMFFILHSWMVKCQINWKPVSSLQTVLRSTWLKWTLGLDTSNTYNSLQPEHVDDNNMSWMTVAIVIDRIAFLIFLILSLTIVFYGI